MEEKEKPRDPVERIERGLTGNFGKGRVALKLQYANETPMYVRVGNKYIITADWCKELIFNQNREIKKLTAAVTVSLVLNGLQIALLLFSALHQ